MNRPFDCAICGAEHITNTALCGRRSDITDGTYFTVGGYCDECPLTNTDEYGLHCNAAQDERTLDEREVHQAPGSWAMGRWPRPDWCPLRKGGVVVAEATSEERGE